MKKIQTENKESDRAADGKGLDIVTTNSAANDNSKKEWQCKICTLINDNFSTYCQACSNPCDGINQSTPQVMCLTSVNMHSLFGN